jgi:hypothetical protein
MRHEVVESAVGMEDSKAEIEELEKDSDSYITSSPETNRIPQHASEFLSGYMETFRRRSKTSTFTSFQKFCIGRRHIYTERSWMIGSSRAQWGDEVCLIYGATVPFILRHVTSKSKNLSFELIGECYLEGLREADEGLDYLDLLGEYGKQFRVSSADYLPWTEVCLL